MDSPRPGPALVAEITRHLVPPGAVGVWWLGQASLVLKAGGAIVYVDPYLADSPRRLVPPAFPPEAVTNADLVLLTHDHSDHIDPTTLPALAAASPAAPLVAPRPVAARVGELVGDPARVVPAVAGERLDVGPVAVVPIPAAHETLDEDPALGFPALGYVLEVDGVTLYLAGDTVPFEGLLEALAPFRIDLAFLPINGRDFFRTRRGTIGNMNEREAAELAAALDVDTVVPVHYGMFANNTVPPGTFVSHLAAAHPEVQCHVLGRFRRWLYHPGRTGGGEAGA